MEGLQVWRQGFLATNDLKGQDSSLLSSVWQALRAAADPWKLVWTLSILPSSGPFHSRADLGL